VTIGQLALALITGGTLAALIECLKVYLGRENGLVFRLKTAEGASLEIDAKNVDDPDIKRALSEAISHSKA
jgi:hypothetical protein